MSDGRSASQGRWGGHIITQWSTYRRETRVAGAVKTAPSSGAFDAAEPRPKHHNSQRQKNAPACQWRPLDAREQRESNYDSRDNEKQARDLPRSYRVEGRASGMPVQVHILPYPLLPHHLDLFENLARAEVGHSG